MPLLHPIKGWSVFASSVLFVSNREEEEDEEDDEAKTEARIRSHDERREDEVTQRGTGGEISMVMIRG
jgi:hypothetical protein